MNAEAGCTWKGRSDSAGLWYRRKPWLALLGILGLLAGSVQLYGCASQSVFAEKDRAAVRAGTKALVLLRVQCTIDDEPQDPFIGFTFTQDPILYFGLGTFETVGEPRFAWHRFLSEESRRAGWTFFLLAPGTYYLAVLGPDSSAMSRISDSHSLQQAPRWRIDVPANDKLIYVGTLQLTGKSQGDLLFGGKTVTPTGGEEMLLTDDHELAGATLAEHFPVAGETKTILMKRWRPGDPIIIRTPGRGTN